MTEKVEGHNTFASPNPKSGGRVPCVPPGSTPMSERGMSVLLGLANLLSAMNMILTRQSMDEDYF